MGSSHRVIALISRETYWLDISPHTASMLGVYFINIEFFFRSGVNMAPILLQAQMENYQMFQKFFVWPKNGRNAWPRADMKRFRIFMWNINRLDKIWGKHPSQFGIEFTRFGDVFCLIHQGMMFWLNTAYTKSLSRPLSSPENTSLLLVALKVQSLVFCCLVNICPSKISGVAQDV